MTQPPPPLDLFTLNAAQGVATKALQDAVCTWEQSASDAAQRGEYRSAQQYKEWAVAADLAVHYVSTALGALVLDALQAFPLVHDTRTVKLPDLGRSDQDHYLDAIAVEVASQQPQPLP